jgi:hypothetical protein
MQDPADTGADDTDMTGAGAAGEAPSPGYTIEITVTGDGKISVGVESADEENAEESGAGGDQGESADQESAEAKPFKNIKDALTYALQIYKNDGEAPEDDGASEDAFQSGFASQ